MAKPPVQNFQEYATVLRKSGLVEKSRLVGILEDVLKLPEVKTHGAKLLAKRLLDEKLITSWQNAHLMKGHSKGFFLGKYKLLRLLGSGGMSSVYLSEHTMMRRQVAIKLLTGTQVDENTTERFRRESRTIGALDHDNIVRAHDFDSDGKFHYLVMEYIDGPTLDTLVEKDGPLPITSAADYMRQASDGLAYAHEHGLVHRDMKPANLVRDAQGVIKILDMGVARITNKDEVSLTLAGDQGVLGTVDYLSPEQALDSHNVDARADIYSLGCSLYYLLTGSPPYPKGSQAQRLLCHQVSPPPDARELREDCPTELAELVQKLMAKKPDDRVQTAEEISRLLRPFAMGSAAKARAAMVAGDNGQPGAGNITDSKLAKLDATIRVVCDGCQSAFRAPSFAAGRELKCPRCGAKIMVPA